MSRVPVPAAHLALGEPRGHPAHAADPVGAGCVQPLHLGTQALRAAINLHQPDVCSSTLVSFVVVVLLSCCCCCYHTQVKEEQVSVFGDGGAARGTDRGGPDTVQAQGLVHLVTADTVGCRYLDISRYQDI